MSIIIPPNAAGTGAKNAAGTGSAATGAGSTGDGFESTMDAAMNAAKSFIHESDFKDFPRIDTTKLIKLINEVAKGEKKADVAAKEFGNPYVDFAKVFVVNKSKELINIGLEKGGMEELTETDFDEKLIACVTSTAALVGKYMSKQISVQEFIDKLGKGEIKNLTKQVLSASGMDIQLAEKMGVENLSEVGSMAPNIVAFAALTAAYKMVREAEKDMLIAREHRIEIENACNESIELIRQYRQEMEYVVNKYLTERIRTFESGFDAMDKAILENDTEGYIRGNAAIQEILGYKAQFMNQEEFDDLMDSDDAFKL